MGKRLVVFGSTGATGSHVVRLALADGLQVRAYARSPHKIPEAVRVHERLEVAEGDFTNTRAIRTALRDADSVICAGGNAKLSKAGRVMSALVRDVVIGMREHGVRRLVYQAGAFSPAPSTRSPLSLRAMRTVVGGLMGISGTLADNDEIMIYLDQEARDIDWTVTRPGLIRERPSKGPIRALSSPGPVCHFVDLAQFTLDTAMSDALTHEFPYVGY
ncbi:MAG: NAD(P)H-binding protein [Myxococcota bacterium]